MTADDDEPPELFRPRPGDEIVEPLFGALRGGDGGGGDGGGEDPGAEAEEDRVPRNGWRGVLWWRIRLLFGRPRGGR